MGSTEESYYRAYDRLGDKPQSNKEGGNNVLKGCKPIIQHPLDEVKICRESS